LCRFFFRIIFALAVAFGFQIDQSLAGGDLFTCFYVDAESCFFS